MQPFQIIFTQKISSTETRTSSINTETLFIATYEYFSQQILVTTNDSRIRIYDLRDLSLSCKFKGYTNQSSQIRAAFR